MSSNEGMGLPRDFGEQATLEADTRTTIPFPANTKQASADINGELTEAMSISFSDKIMITITQKGRLAQWVNVPLLSDNPTDSDPYFATSSVGNDSLLPTARFQARTLLGAGSHDREIMGQLYASQIASMIISQKPDEHRPLLLGLGLAKVDVEREVFLEIVDLALQVI